MPPPRKEICDCGILEHASKEPGHVIRWDDQLKEYHILYGKGGQMMIYYCPFCGGSTPKSQRSRLFHTLTDAECQRLCDLTKNMRTLQEVVASFGEPDIKQPVGMTVTKPEREGEPETTRSYPVMIYTKLSDIADVHVTIYPTDRVGISFQGKAMAKNAG
ncbi:MAG TPA: hypothetical protein VLT36_04145 [Candidatus Dormibacteraeota bacterium]|nr:hypothetical protein [Candidatus Dormibacteraeota bacterium]